MHSNSKKTTEIHVCLKNEGVDVWRPTQAIDLGGGLFELLPTPNYDPELEEWEFLPGSTVRAKPRFLSEGEVLVAVEKVRE